MSMQDLRDGIRVEWRKLWRSLWRLAALVSAVSMMILTVLQYHAGHIDRATFDAVIVLWTLHWAREDN